MDGDFLVQSSTCDKTRDTLKTRCRDLAYSSNSQSVVPKTTSGGPGGQNYFHNATKASWSSSEASLNRLQKQIRESGYLLLSRKLENCKNIKQHLTYFGKNSNFSFKNVIYTNLQ